MRFIGYNTLPICFLALAAFMIWMQTDGWGWCIFFAFLLAAIPKNDDSPE